MPTYTWQVHVGKLMKARGMTQRQLAEETGISAPSLSRLVNSNLSRVDLKILAILAEYFEVDNTNDLLELVINK
ncbi:MAG: helix-turn-helix transcriptional regulator [Moorea sp. SIO3I7]|nr:helix-turn-helix transcriptional regulator [Moorena sp. SIO3I7]